MLSLDTIESRYYIPSDGKKWYALYTRSRAERKAASALEESGIESWVPVMRSLRTWSDRRRWIDVPVIPGYCFVRITRRQMLPALQIDYVGGIVRFNGQPAMVNDYQIDFLKRMLKQNECQWEVTKTKLSPGQKIHIIRGPFIGFDAELVTYKGKKIVCVRVDHTGNSLLVHIPTSDILAITGPYLKY